MQIKVSSPKHYESYHGSSAPVRAYLDRIEKTAGEAPLCQVLDTLRISLLIASPEELAQGKFLAYETFDWRCGYAAIGVNGDFERYHSGDDWDKICVLSEMLCAAFERVGKKRKANFDSALAKEIVAQITQAFKEHLLC